MTERISTAELAARLEIGERLEEGRPRMLDPQDLPGRYGRVVRSIDRVLAAMGCEAGLAGGWAVWRHGYVGRLTQDVDIVLPAARIDEFLRVASVSGFDPLPLVPGRWPKLMHKETGVRIDVLPEGARPGTSAKPAPTLIPSPARLGAQGNALRYVHLNGLLELKLAAGRARDEADVVELLRANPGCREAAVRHLSGVHAEYVETFERLWRRAVEQGDE